MFWNYTEMTDLFSNNSLNHLLLLGKWGLEKEALRVTPDGYLALTPHPEAFGDKTDNPYIKTDFSESQIELVTPALNSIEKTFNFLKGLQTTVEQEIRPELLWPLSMPGPLPDDDTVPIARYNDSMEGSIKEIYRAGLVLRYGVKMQMISGIHYNFSFSKELWDYLYPKYANGIHMRDFIDTAYFSLARNFLRYRWLLIYLFGASPVADSSYVDEILLKCRTYVGGCDSVNDVVRNSKDATSLRTSPFGYDTTLQNNVHVSYDSLEGYIRDLRAVLSRKSSVFSELGLVKNGKHIQLNENQLQLENEYYAPIRFKQVINSHESQLEKLEANGINHIELRIFDLDPFEKTGISLEQMIFIHVFIIFCLFERSDYISEAEAIKISHNAHKTALAGRASGLSLLNNNTLISLEDWGEEILRKLQEIAWMLDNKKPDRRFYRSIEQQYHNFSHPQMLPSARIVRELSEYNESYTQFGLSRASKYLTPTTASARDNSNTMHSHSLKMEQFNLR